MAKENKTLNEAFEMVKAKREVIRL